jgi:quercetin dioxygenase-like cupin family protein
MSEDIIFIDNLEDLIEDFPPDSILSRTIYQDKSLKTILFGFQPGQELSEHTAAVPAILHFLTGDAQVILGDHQHQAQKGSWVHIPANLPHSIHAKSETHMLLMLILNG